MWEELKLTHAPSIRLLYNHNINKVSSFGQVLRFHVGNQVRISFFFCERPLTFIQEGKQ